MFTNGQDPSSSHSTVTAETANWAGLSEEGRWRLQQIALPIACGLSEIEVDRRLDTTWKWVSRQLDLLARELERLT
jgi:hypothetical protein